MDQVGVVLPDAVAHDITECRRAGKERHGQGNDRGIGNLVAACCGWISLETGFLAQHHGNRQQQYDDSATYLHCAKSYPQQAKQRHAKKGGNQQCDRDADADGYGNSGLTNSSCAQPTGYVSNNTDCNDGSASVHPGASETCNSVDDDCDGLVDDGATAVTWYRDLDGDGYGDSGPTSSSCAQPTGYVANSTDCDDTDSAVNPGEAEESDDGLDNDCDGTIDNGLVVSVDATTSAGVWSLCYAVSTPYWDWDHWYWDSDGDSVLDDGYCLQVAAGVSSIFVEEFVSGTIVQMNGDRVGGWLVENLGRTQHLDVINDGDQLAVGTDPATDDCWTTSSSQDIFCRIP